MKLTEMDYNGRQGQRRISEGDEDLRAYERVASQGGLEEQFVYYRRVLRRMGKEEQLAYLKDLYDSKIYEPEFIWDLARGYDFNGLRKLISKIGKVAVEMGLLESDRLLHYNVKPFVGWSSGPHLVRVVWKDRFNNVSARLVFEDSPDWYREDSPVIFVGNVFIDDTTSFTKRVPLDLGVPRALRLVLDLLERVRSGDRTASGVHVVRS